MCLGEILIKVIGIVLAIVGIALLLALVGINFIGVGLAAPWFVELIVGVLFLSAGIYIIRGGSINL